MGRKKGKWVWILKDATLAYKQSQIDKFINWWNEGQPVSFIAEKLEVPMYDVALLVMHCELDNLIEPRPGGLKGTEKHNWRQKQKAAEA